MKVSYQGKSITLDSTNSLGAGGEAEVIKHGGIAFKIYHTPTPQRAEKLRAFFKRKFQLPDNVAYPIDVVKNTRGKVIGFTMRIAKNCNDFRLLRNYKKWRVNEQVSIARVIDPFIHAKETMDVIHSQGLFVGDVNDLNTLFNDQLLSVFIDVDSFQFDNFPCPVGTEDFIDPRLYGVNLESKPCFTRETDIYAFTVMLFRSLLYVHPYGGTHKKVRSLFDRAQQGIMAFDPQVVYPKIGVNPEVLGDNLLQHFEDVFKHKKRPDLPVSLLRDQQAEFTQCSKCQAHFSNTRSKCPVCQKVHKQQVDITQIVTQKKQDATQYMVEHLLGTEGTILFAKVIRHTKLVAVVYEEHMTNLYIFGSTTKKLKLWDGHRKGVYFGFFDTYLVMSLKGSLMIFDTKTSSPVGKTTTGLFSSGFHNRPLFVCSDNFLYRTTGSNLMRCRVENGLILDESICPIIENQTWAKFGDNDVGLGFYRVFSKYEYFLLIDGKKIGIELPHLDGQLIDFEVLFSEKTFLIMRKNLDKGRTYTHWHMMMNDGSLIKQSSMESLSADVWKDIYGKVFVGTSVMHPSDAGVVIEKEGSMSLRSSTVDYVSSESQLFLYKSGIAVVSRNSVKYLH